MQGVKGSSIYYYTYKVRMIKIRRNRAWLLVLQHSEKLVHNFRPHVLKVTLPVCLERALEQCYESESSYESYTSQKRLRNLKRFSSYTATIFSEEMQYSRPERYSASCYIHSYISLWPVVIYFFTEDGSLKHSSFLKHFWLVQLP